VKARSPIHIRHRLSAGLGRAGQSGARTSRTPGCRWRCWAPLPNRRARACPTTGSSPVVLDAMR
jgi:hypothetical protein